ncbi:PRC-barrel domain-containing protein [Coleofasciculus sp. F4-SAH-05]|uniref:PRC-barrel domain-containing protein n=1 Tax=Coleofasciculus sp. F4-SAH-05 TaxID=3069525 RepID=UPI0032FFECD7
MSTKAELLKQSELLNRLVLDRHTTEEVGRVTQLWLDWQAHRVVGLTCKSGFLGGKKHHITWEQVNTVGSDSILVNSLKEETESETLELLESPIGVEVWTDAGNKVGKFVDYIIEPETGAIVNYLYSSSGWQGMMDGIYTLAPVAVSSVGKKRIIVLEEAVKNSDQYTEGIHERMSQAAEFIRSDYKKTLEDMESLKQGVPQVTENLTDQAKSAGDKFKEQFSDGKNSSQKKDEE